MIEDKAIKLEPGDYILEYDTQKVARVELINMVEGLCDRGIRLWLVRSRGGDALRIVPKETSTTKTTEPMSFEPGDSVLEYITINNIKYLPETPPEEEPYGTGQAWATPLKGAAAAWCGDFAEASNVRTSKPIITTPPGGELHLKNNGKEDLILFVKQGSIDPLSDLVPPEKETPPTDDASHTEWLRYYANKDAIAAYKKRLVEKLRQASWYDDGAAEEQAIKIVEQSE